MTKPIPGIGGGITSETRAKTFLIYTQLHLGVCEETIRKHAFYFCLRPIINFNLCNPTYSYSLINDACYQLRLRGNGQC